MMSRHAFSWTVALMLVLTAGGITLRWLQAGDNPKQEEEQAEQAGESERKVGTKEVPEAALATLKKLAAGATITEFAEEKEHGHTFYEGSWNVPGKGKRDVLVTPTGDLVEIEQSVGAAQVPKAVEAVARKAAGADVGLAFEKKTVILYEARFRHGDHWQELLLTPDGRPAP